MLHRRRLLRVLQCASVEFKSVRVVAHLLIYPAEMILIKVNTASVVVFPAHHPSEKNSKKYFLRLNIIHLFITCWVIEVLEVLPFSLVKREVVSKGRMAKNREQLGLAIDN